MWLEFFERKVCSFGFPGLGLNVLLFGGLSHMFDRA